MLCMATRWCSTGKSMGRINGDKFFFSLIMISVTVYSATTVQALLTMAHCISLWISSSWVGLCKVVISLGFCFREFRVVFLFSIISMSKELSNKFWLSLRSTAASNISWQWCWRCRVLQSGVFAHRNVYFLILFHLFYFLSSSTYQWTVYKMILYIKKNSENLWSRIHYFLVK